jgi:beta-glucosidase
MLEDRPHRELAREAARQSLILLKNEGQLLPLNKEKGRKIAVIGPMAGSCHLGGYSGRSTDLVSPYAGIANALGVTLFRDGVVPAGDYLSTSNFRGAILGFSGDGSQLLTKVTNNTWAHCGPLDFTGRTSIAFEVASQSDGDISLYLDSLSSSPSLTAYIPATGGIEMWKTIAAELNGISGQHVVFLRLISSIRDKFLNMRSIRLLPPANTYESAIKVVYSLGCSITGPKIDALFKSAVKAATRADVALVFVGDNRILSNKGRDRFDIALPEVQQDLVKAILAANPRTVIVINSSCPVAIDEEVENALAVLLRFSAANNKEMPSAARSSADITPAESYVPPGFVARINCRTFMTKTSRPAGHTGTFAASRSIRLPIASATPASPIRICGSRRISFCLERQFNSLSTSRILATSPVTKSFSSMFTPSAKCSAPTCS